MTAPKRTLTMKSPSETKCACCGAVGDCPIVNNGLAFCKLTCESAYYGRINEWLDRAKLERVHHLKPDITTVHEYRRSEYPGGNYD